MSGTTIIAERDQTDAPISIQVNRDGGITGLTVVIRIYNGDDVTEFLDFNDGVFKAAGHTTPTLTLTEVGLGLYAVDGGFDLSAITIPAATSTLLVQYDITAGGESGTALDTIQLVTSFIDIPTDVRALILADATAFNGADIAAILADTAAIDTVTAATLDATVSSRAVPGDAMDLVADAVDASAVAASGAAEIAVASALAVWSTPLPGAFGAGEAGEILGTNLDAAVSSRSSHSAADVNTVLTGSHGAGAWVTATGFATPGDAMTLTAGERAAVAAAAALDVWGTPVPGAFGAGTAGSILGSRLDQAVSTTESNIRGGVQTLQTLRNAIDSLDASLDKCKLNVSIDPGTNQLRIGAWLTRGGVNVAAPTAITIHWYDLDGLFANRLFTLTESDAEAGPPAQDPDANGRYYFLRAQALADDQVYKVSVAITDAIGTVTTFKDVQTVATS